MKFLANSRLPIILPLLFLLEPLRSEMPPSKDQIFAQVRENFLNQYRSQVLNEANLKLEIRLNNEVPNYFGGMDVKGESLVIILGARAHLEPQVTPDSYLALLCHEVGHRLAGAPYQNRPGVPAWSSSEGQSDYYAARFCLPRIFRNDPTTFTMDLSIIPQQLQLACKEAWTNSIDVKVCLRTLKAGKEMMDSIHSIYELFPSPPPKAVFLNPEADGISTNELYPSFQCRLDTFVHGALGKQQPACWMPKQAP